MTFQLKICGMREPANIVEVAALRPDYMGFIFYDQSPRFVGKDFELPSIPQSIKKIGVFVNERTDSIVRTVSEYQLDLVQLHGNETPAQCEELKSKGIEVIKVFSIDEHFDFVAVNSFKTIVRYFLFDTKGKYLGGNGRTFDWSLLKKYDQSIPFFLSGGISSENVQDVREISDLNAHVLDLNSGVEVSPGLKSIEKIKEIKRVIDSF